MPAIQTPDHHEPDDGNGFTLNDFRRELAQILRPKLIVKMLGLLPGMGEMVKLMQAADSTREAQRLLGIIDGMTRQERCNPKIINPSRRNRIANGSGAPVQEVAALLKHYDTLAPLMKAIAGKGLDGRMQAIQERLRRQDNDGY